MSPEDQEPSAVIADGTESASAPEVAAPAVREGEPSPEPVSPPDGEPSTSAEPVAPEGGAPAESSADDFPSLTSETYDWEAWRGESYDHIPEQSRGWAEAAATRQLAILRADLDEQLATAKADAERWKSYYLQDSDVEDDPRVAEAVASKEAVVAELEGLKGQLTTLQAELETEKAGRATDKEAMQMFAQRSAQRYGDWFEKAYKDQLEGPGGAEAAQGMMRLLEVEPPVGVAVPDIEPHQAFDIALTGGAEAIDQASKMLSRGVHPDEIHALLLKAYGQPAAAPKPQPRESASLVEDGSTGQGSPPPRSQKRKKASGDPIADAVAAAVAKATKAA